MPGRLAGQLVDGGDPVADEPVYVVDTGPADESNWSIVATDRSAADGSWSVTVPNADAERYHAVAQFEDGETLKNALSKPFLTSQPFVQANAVSVGFDVLSPAVSVGSAIPDSVVLQYFATSWEQGDGVWTDDNGVENIDIIGSPQDSTLSDGKESLDFNGVDDYGEFTLPGEFTENSLTEFSIEFSIQYTTDSTDMSIFGLRNDDGDQFIEFLTNRDGNRNTDTGNLMFNLRDDSGDRVQLSFDGSQSLNDGTRKDISVIVEDSTTNDVRLILNGEERDVFFGNSESPSNFTTWDHDMPICARNLSGSVGNYFDVDVGAVRWHDEAITNQTIGDY